MPATTNQEHFRVRIDSTAADQTSGGTQVWGAAQDVNYSIAAGVKFRIRFVLSNTGGNSTTSAKNLYSSHNGGTYAQVTTVTSFIQSVDATAGASADNSNITNELLTAVGTFVTLGQYDTDGTTGSFALAATSCCEIEYGLVVPIGTAVGDTLDFRMRPGNVVVNGLYNQTPRITVIAAASTIYAPLKQYLRR